MKISKIVITGGPCAGKSSSLKILKEEFSRIGYTVLLISETATELMSGGITPLTCRTKAEYQKYQLKLQIEKEKVFLEAATAMNTDKVLIICDRGALDNKAYMLEREFTDAINDLGFNEQSLCGNYDAVFHLVTAANGAEEFYTTENNTVRTETIEQAAELDQKLISVWQNHPYYRIIESSLTFEEKMKNLIFEISKFLKD